MRNQKTSAITRLGPSPARACEPVQGVMRSIRLRLRSYAAPLLILSGVLLLPGCGGSDDESPPVPAAAPGAAGIQSAALRPQVDSASAQHSGSASSPAASGNDVEFAPLGLSALSGNQPDYDQPVTSRDGEQQMRDVIERLQPLQVLLGRWRGTTRRDYEGFKAVDGHEWVWDLQSDPDHPSLSVASDKSPYLREARLTWNSAAQNFVLTATDGQGVTRTLAGDFTDPVHEEIGSDDKLHRVFRLQFTQGSESGPDAAGEYWQIAFVQQENNRYLLEIDKRRGSAPFVRFDTVSTQREGTSFALSDSDYGEKTCIISEGLGTIELTYKGRSYWVCCTGCSAAFEADPEKWIALAAKRAREKKEIDHADP